MCRNSLPVLAGVLLVLALPSRAAAQEVAVIVGFHGDADPGIFARHGGSPGTDLGSIGAQAGRVPAGRLRALKAEAGVAYVEEDIVRQATVTPNDTHYAAYQADDFGLINAPAAWDLSTGSGIRVAVLDTGCQLNHPDIGSGASGKVKVWRNFSSGKATDVADKNGHGTHTAGTVGARTNNGTGVAGAGFNCELAIGKVLGPKGGYDSWIAAGLNWSWQTANAKVVNMSLGGPGSSSTLQNAVDAAWNNGLVVVAAAGNESSSAPSYPAAYTNCISVAATDSSANLASFSNFGSTVDLAAPGVSIASTYKGSAYVLMSGTSMASPHVAGVAALVWASSHGSSNTNVRARLEGTATLPVAGANAGSLKVVDAYASLAAP